MDLHFKNKIAVVTGASRGIGLAVVRAFVQEGVRVIAASRNPGEALAQLATQLPVWPLTIDVAIPDGPALLVEHAVERYGAIDILVNNAGALDPQQGSGFLAISDIDWLHILEVNFLSIVRVCRATLPVMVEHRGGVIVNISSINARMPSTALVAYSSAKAAVANLSKALSEEFGPKGVRVNTISPGPVRTPMWEEAGGLADTITRMTGIDRCTIMEHLPKMSGVTLGRFAEADEIAALVLFLVSDRAAMITGSDYVIDGGVIKTL